MKASMRDPKEVLREADRREIRRYLGYRGREAEPAVEEAIDRCREDLIRESAPRAAYRRFELEKGEDGSLVLIRPEEAGKVEEMRILSRDLARNLEGCLAVYMMAATLGPGPDRLVRRAEILRVSHTVIYQAAGAAMAEAWCDAVNERIREEEKAEGLFLRPRFSPGYGDLPLTCQKDFMRILRMDRDLGIRLSESLLMTPTKSVTAFIGVTDQPGRACLSGCAACGAADCPYRKE